MSELYIKMMESHPVQLEWKPTFGDKFVHTKGYIKNPVMFVDGWFPIRDFRNTDDYFMFGHTWLPRQEDWQRIYYKYFDVEHGNPDRVVSKFKDFLGGLNVDGKYTDWVIWWCLFVSREVYGLEWSWSEKKWIPEKQWRVIQGE